MFSARAVAPCVPYRPTSYRSKPNQAPVVQIARALWPGRFSAFNVRGYDDENHLHQFEFMFADQQGNVPNLINSDIDYPVYQEAYATLSMDEVKAIRGWFVVDENPLTGARILNDGTAFVSDSFNLAINTRLERIDFPKDFADHTVNNLTLAMGKLPCVSGEFCCMVEHEAIRPSPWGHSIEVGDVVSCRPCFLPAYTELRYVAQALSDKRRLHQRKIDTVVIYKITASQELSAAVSLINGTNSMAAPSWEDLILFPQESFFRVDGVAVAEPVHETDEPLLERNVRRVGVVLTQVEPQAENVKNMFNGLEISNSPPR